MNARKKINSHVFLGCLIAAAIVGYFTSSVAVFVISAVVLIGLGTYSGDIRMNSKKRSWRNRRRRW
jgi:hypothetical protein